MSIEIPAVALSAQKAPPELKSYEMQAPAPIVTQEKKVTDNEPKKSDVELIMRSLVQAAGIFNKRLSYRINDELGLVVVKVIDTDTDKVIKELPEQEIQRMMARLKETIGLLVDESI
jgi:flagellar protein FlaG